MGNQWRLLPALTFSLFHCTIYVESLDSLNFKVKGQVSHYVWAVWIAGELLSPASLIAV